MDEVTTNEAEAFRARLREESNPLIDAADAALLALREKYEQQWKNVRAAFIDRAHVEAWHRHICDLARAQPTPKPKHKLTCDDGFDMFSTPLHSLEDEIAQTDDPYTLGYLLGVLDFRQQMSMILGTEKA